MATARFLFDVIKAPDALLAHLKLHLTGDAHFPTPFFFTIFEFINDNTIIEIIMKDRDRNIKVLRFVLVSHRSQKNIFFKSSHWNQAGIVERTKS